MSKATEIKNLFKEIVNLGPVLPGSISQVYKVCGNKNCKCKDPVSPEKHGPYDLLSFTVGDKSSTKFIKKGELDDVDQMRKNCRRLREICQELPLACIEFLRENDISEIYVLFDELRSLHSEKCSPSEKRLMHKIRELEKSLERWRDKATERTAQINSLKARVRQLEDSRDRWKKRAQKAERNIIRKMDKSIKKN